MAVFAESATSGETRQFDLAAVRRDLQTIDAYVSQGQGLVEGDGGAVVGVDIKVRDIYRDYLGKASQISGELIDVRTRMTRNDNTLSLQQLGALSQDIVAKNIRFRDGFTHGERDFQTYRLIETAVTNLQDAIEYWRVANKYRALYRGSKIERAEDDEILQTKLQTAMAAIDELNAIMVMRRKLDADLEEDY